VSGDRKEFGGPKEKGKKIIRKRNEKDKKLKGKMAGGEGRGI
jgi:hypothetical protein